MNAATLEKSHSDANFVIRILPIGTPKLIMNAPTTPEKSNCHFVTMARLCEIWKFMHIESKSQKKSEKRCTSLFRHGEIILFVNQRCYLVVQNFIQNVGDEVFQVKQ